MIELNAIKQKILLLLAGGLALGFTYNPKKQWKIIREVSREWRKINEKTLQEEIRKLYRSRLIVRKENPDGSFSFILNERGKLRVLNYRFEEMILKQEEWDEKWRLVIFDIPEKKKISRDALREKLKKLGFYELQKSVFIFPYECRDEIDFIIEFFELRPYVRIILATEIDNELHLKKVFKLV